MAAIYQANIWCDDCATAIRKRLRLEGKAPEHPSDERTYDSDEYPKIASDDEESDSPQHCAAHESCLNAIELPSGRKIGMLFGNLTSNGVTYVRETALESGGEVAELWVRHLDTREKYNETKTSME